MTESLSHIELLAKLHYEPRTGDFTWKIDGKVMRVGDIAGCNYGPPTGYWRVGLNGRSYLAHRLAWFYVHGVWPSKTIDHINGIKTDNRIANLRDVDQSTNNSNCHKPVGKQTSSGLRGVSFHKGYGKWRAAMRFKGKNLWLGVFTTPEAAHAAYLAKKLELHGPLPMQAGEVMEELS
jgi:hypothetical protein